MLEYVAIATAITTPIITYFIAKQLIKQSKEGLIDDILDALDDPETHSKLHNFFSTQLNNVETQKMIHGVGTLLGNGIKTGVGFSGRGGAKINLEGLVMQGISKFLGLDLMGEGGNSHLQQPAQPARRKVELTP